jgi:hypothetical protein
MFSWNGWSCARATIKVTATAILPVGTSRYILGQHISVFSPLNWLYLYHYPLHSTSCTVVCFTVRHLVFFLPIPPFVLVLRNSLPCTCAAVLISLSCLSAPAPPANCSKEVQCNLTHTHNPHPTYPSVRSTHDSGCSSWSLPCIAAGWFLFSSHPSASHAYCTITTTTITSTTYRCQEIPPRNGGTTQVGLPSNRDFHLSISLSISLFIPTFFSLLDGWLYLVCVSSMIIHDNLPRIFEKLCLRHSWTPLF